MPEGDIVWWTCRRLDAALAGDVLTGCELRVPRLATVDLTGVRVSAAVSRGKHQLIRLENGLTVHTHLQMDGAWRFVRGNRQPDPGEDELRVLLRTPRGAALGYRLPVVELIATEAEHTVVGHLGPDLLGPDWDAEEAVRRLATAPDRTIGEALLDQRNLAGIGTFWRAEICFLQGIHPRRPVGEIRDLGRLCRRAQQLLDAAKTRFQVTTGDTVPGQRAWVFERTRRPCRRCGTPIAYEQLGPPGRVRNSYWCPTCQPI